ncbi:DUF397 domain-containing protein [Actinomadura roseirufa]|uniref:DUF397 domain-containing protein n=1 Tax=Actinomadura roseirufa TaxID=2094049 RepID=UPI001040E6D7|nr:DUF397 domain-containing protein [Actinomadura roseirufa]
MTEWRKSMTYGEGSVNGACVELARLDGRVGLRDSQDPEGPAYSLPRESLAGLLAEVKAGQYEL